MVSHSYRPLNLRIKKTNKKTKNPNPEKKGEGGRGEGASLTHGQVCIIYAAPLPSPTEQIQKIAHIQRTSYHGFLNGCRVKVVNLGWHESRQISGKLLIHSQLLASDRANLVTTMSHFYLHFCSRMVLLYACD